MLESLSARKLFLVDSAGALLTAVLTGFVLVRMQPVFGMPQKPLLFLSAIAFMFSVYSLLCYFFVRRWPAPFLKMMALMNFLYCSLTLALVVYHRDVVTIWGWLYFLGEAVIIIMLVMAELKKAKQS